MSKLSNNGFSGSFQARLAWLFHNATRELLTSDGWRNFDHRGAGITHEEIEERVDMDKLARLFEEWLNGELDKINRSTPKFDTGKEFHLPFDCPLAIHVDPATSRVTDLYKEWVKAGSPPLGVSLSRWWDRRLADLGSAIRVHEGDDLEEIFHHGECAMPKCTCTHYNDDRDHWAPCPYRGQRISRDAVSTHRMIMGG